MFKASAESRPAPGGNPGLGRKMDRNVARRQESRHMTMQLCCTRAIAGRRTRIPACRSGDAGVLLAEQRARAALLAVLRTAVRTGAVARA
jgi:hypothetical protein